jgi:hypothetical protein
MTVKSERVMGTLTTRERDSKEERSKTRLGLRRDVRAGEGEDGRVACHVIQSVLTHQPRIGYIMVQTWLRYFSYPFCPLLPSLFIYGLAVTV